MFVGGVIGEGLLVGWAGGWTDRIGSRGGKRGCNRESHERVRREVTRFALAAASLYLIIIRMFRDETIHPSIAPFGLSFQNSL